MSSRPSGPSAEKSGGKFNPGRGKSSTWISIVKSVHNHTSRKYEGRLRCAMNVEYRSTRVDVLESLHKRISRAFPCSRSVMVILSHPACEDYFPSIPLTPSTSGEKRVWTFFCAMTFESRILTTFNSWEDPPRHVLPKGVYLMQNTWIPRKDRPAFCF